MKVALGSYPPEAGVSSSLPAEAKRRQGLPAEAKRRQGLPAEAKRRQVLPLLLVKVTVEKGHGFIQNGLGQLRYMSRVTVLTASDMSSWFIRNCSNRAKISNELCRNSSARDYPVGHLKRFFD